MEPLTRDGPTHYAPYSFPGQPDRTDAVAG
jgi:hypothetical protein